MNKMKHTPGPWKISGDGNMFLNELDNVFFVIDSTYLREVAICRNRDGESRANARLIAAAPELAGACRIALEVIRRHDLDAYCGEDELTDPDGVKGIGDVLRAALEKAGVSNAP